jgi:transposase
VALFLGDDWAEAHHDIELVDESGRRLARLRLPEGVDGLSTLRALIADHLDEADEPDQVVVGIETDRGPWVQALIAAGYTVYAINPRQVARYRERHGTAGAKSDPGDAHVLARCEPSRGRGSRCLRPGTCHLTPARHRPPAEH